MCTKIPSLKTSSHKVMLKEISDILTGIKEIFLIHILNSYTILKKAESALVFLLGESLH